MSKQAKDTALSLRKQRPEIGTPAWTAWHRKCVREAERFMALEPDLSLMDFWALCGMPN